MYDNKKWSGRFNEPIAKSTQNYTQSVDYDKRLAQVDIQASLAHARMLTENGVISQKSYKAIEQGMSKIQSLIEQNAMPWSEELEDVHMNIERKLTELIGAPGKELHTGRSRNDQVATDLRLWLRGAIDAIIWALENLQKALIKVAEKNVYTVMPGYTHLQVAQPVSFAHYLLAYLEMFNRDKERLQDARKRVNRSPLGAAALAGTSFAINPERTAELLGFESVCQNSLDAVSDRDFVIEFLSAASILVIHISRLAEEIAWWMNPQFAFISVPDRFCTGSSIMPQKRNPDVVELSRGKSARVIGHLMTLAVLMKAQPLAYNRDNQEDKEPLFDTVDQVLSTLNLYSELVLGLTAHKQAMRKAVEQGYATATDLADYLVKKGMLFRDSHEVVAQVVKKAEEEGKTLQDLSLITLQGFSSVIKEDVYEVLSPEGSMESRKATGGTAPSQIEKQLKRWKEILGL